MKRIHIAFVVYLAHPSVGPTLPIVKVLVRRGYRVTYVTSDQFASRVAAEGAEVVLCRGMPEPSPLDWTMDEKGNYQDQLTRLAERTLEEILPRYRDDRPALVVYDYAALAGQIVAKRLGVPAIQISPVFAHDARVHSRQVRDVQFREMITTWSRKLDSFLQKSGIPDSNFLFHREKLNIYLFPRLLQPCREVMDTNCFYAGRCPGEQPHYGIWQLTSDDGRPVILVSTSTLYVQGAEYFKTCVEALSSLRCTVILSIGEAADPASLGRLPSNVQVVQNVSHVKILPHVSLFICLGGVITTAEAMYHGVPLIVATHGFQELEYLADNIVDLGIGVHLAEGDFNAEALNRTAERVLQDASILERMKRVQGIVRREPGAEDAANRIEEYLEEAN